MGKILGLDLGTNSIGWAVVDKDIIEEGKEIYKLLDKGVAIFPEGVKKDKGNESSKAAERTRYRSARRIKFRRKIRKYNTLIVLAENKMCPLGVDEVDAWRKSNFKNYPVSKDFLNWLRTDNQPEKTERKKQVKNPYSLRDKASKEVISKLELGRVFYHMAQRRGFLSNRLDQSDKGIIELHQQPLDLIINENENTTSLRLEIESYIQNLEITDKKSKDLDEGEKKLKALYSSFEKTFEKESDIQIIKEALLEKLYKKENQGAVKEGISTLSDKMNGFDTLGQYFYSIYGKNDEKIRGNYTGREEHYLAEFNFICNKQNIDKELKQKLYNAIFFQRPLKSQKGLVGKCSFENNKARCPISRPEFEEFRMYAFINNIKIKTPEDDKLRFLYREEINQIIPKFQRKSKPNFDFEDIAKELFSHGVSIKYYKDKGIIASDYLVNYKLNTSISGCPTISLFTTILGNDWRTKTYSSKEINKNGNQKSYDFRDIWHVWSTFTKSEKLKDFAINKLGLNDKIAEKFSKVILKKEYSSLSLKSINKILKYLKEGLLYSHAVFMANIENIVDVKIWENKDNRKYIEAKIENIIEKHQDENKILFAINSLLSKSIDGGWSDSKEAVSYFKKDFTQHLIEEFGKNKWNNIKDKETLLDESLTLFRKHLNGKTFAKIQRIDEKVIDFLNGKNENGEILCSDSSKIEKLYHPSDIEKFKAKTIETKDGRKYRVLGSPMSNSIKNPMAMKSLHQLRKLINTLIIEEQIDENTKVNIELARDLNDANKRKAIQRWQRDREELRKTYAEKLKELYFKETSNELNPTEEYISKFELVLEQRSDNRIITKEDILKYELWKEQNHICLYTGKSISISALFGPNPQFDIEHTIPRSISYDNSQENKTICDNDYNRNFKKNRIPFDLQADYDEILPRITHWKKRYEDLDDKIQKLKRVSKNASDKEQKDKIIQKRHYITMEYNYWKGKYNRFVMEEVKAGFKNSQLVDIGLITRYAQEYLRSYFNKVYSVKGSLVAEFRKAWGLHDSYYDELGKKHYRQKDRSNHIHHCTDAITIACMSKKKYGILAHAWALEDKSDLDKCRRELEKSKPWKSFAEDVRNIDKETLIVHSSKDVLPVQSKRKIRKRGVIQYVVEYKKDNQGNYLRNDKGEKIPMTGNDGKFVYKLNEKGERIPRYMQGDTVRGSLHQETFYGAIGHNKNGEISRDENQEIIPQYVLRKEINTVSKSDIENIVDKEVKRKFEDAISTGILKFKNVQGKEIAILEKGATIWMNEEKGIPIKKVRCFVPSVTYPIKLKKHKDLSIKVHKHHYHVKNDENYCMALYEGKDKNEKIKRNFEVINNIDAGRYFRLSNKMYRDENPIAPLEHDKSKLEFKCIVRKGINVLFYKETSDEIWDLDQSQIQKRLYKIIGFEGDGRIQFRFHQTAMQQSSLNKDEMTISRYMKEQNLKNSVVNFETPVPWLRLTVSNFNMLIQNIDFKITESGKIIEIR